MFKRIATSTALVALLLGTGCSSVEKVVANVNSSSTNVINQLAKLSSTDAAQAVTDSIGTGTATAPQFPDDYQCTAWIAAQIPVWQKQASGLLPSTNAKGPLSAFVEAKIAIVNAQGMATNVSTSVPAGFAHNCGAAMADDIAVANQIIAAVTGGAVQGATILGISVPKI